MSFGRAMRFLSVFILANTLALAPLSLAQENVATVVVYVTVPPSPSPASPIATQQDTATQAQISTAADPTILETRTSSGTPSSTLPSVVAASAASSTPSSQASSMTTEYNASGAPGQGGDVINTDGGASGPDNSSFHLSKGGLAAIIIVVILVALFGIASIVLFIIAKRRSWTMRQTISRASRRLTGRGIPCSTAAANRQSRRTGVRMESPLRPGVKAVYPPGHKRGLVVDVKDPEKGLRPLDGKAPVNTRPREKSWAQKLWNGGWK